MTASVLIINSNNICLGSDSNVTIDNVKTFTGVKKLHCLCDELPMAIMNYGNAEFAFIDFETIVGEFKKRNEINKVSSVKNIVKNFIEFLKEFTDSEDCDEFIEYYLNEFKKELIILIQEMDEIDFLEFLKNIETKNLLNFLNGYTIDFSEIVPNYMVDFEYVNLKLLHAFSTYLEDNSVGVVIAGFDKEFNRPSFVNFNLFFNNNGKIEWKCNYLEENYDGVSILTFAQDDEIKAFIEGIDKYFENELINYWRDMINILFNDLFESISKNNSFNEDLINVLKYELDTFKNKFGVYESMFNEELSELKNENYDNLRNIIEILPKNDLADLVHFLIMIPSAKRRFSFDLNSVGGDINVCLMSKVDFQWIDYTNG